MRKTKEFKSVIRIQYDRMMFWHSIVLPRIQPIHAASTARRRRIALVAIAGSLWAIALSSMAVPDLRLMEARLADRFAAWMLPVEGRSEAVTVVLTDEDPLDSPVERRLDLARIIAALSDFSPRAIGLALPGLRPTLPSVDAALRSAILDAGIPVIVMDPVIVRDNDAPAPESDWKGASSKFLFDAIETYPTVLTPSGADRAVRKLAGTQAGDGGARGFETRLAGAGRDSRRAGAPHASTRAGPLRFRRGAPDGSGAFDIVASRMIGETPDRLYRDRVVLVGRGSDLRPVPSGVDGVNEGAQPMAPIAVISAHGVDMLMHGRVRPEANLFWSYGAAAAALVAIAIAVNAGWTASDGRMARCLALGAVAALSIVGGGLGAARLEVALLPTGALAAAAVLAAISGYAAGAAARARAAEISLERMAPDAFQPRTRPLKPQRRQVSALSVRIDDFAALADAAAPDRVAALAEMLAQRANRAAGAQGGLQTAIRPGGQTILFGVAPTAPDHAPRAIACAAELLAGCPAFEGVNFRCVIATGESLAGQFLTIGANAAGQAIELADRLQTVARRIDVRLLVTEPTLRSLESADLTTDPLAALSNRPVGALRFDKPAEPVPAFEIALGESQDPAAIERYRTAYRAMAAGRPDALALFRRVLEAYPDDPLAALHLNRLSRGETGVTVSFDRER